MKPRRVMPFVCLWMCCLALACGEDTPEEKDDYTAPACGDGNISAVFRLDFLTLDLKGYTVLTPYGEPLAAEDAAYAAFQEFTKHMALRHPADWYGGSEPENNPMELAAETPAGSAVYAAFYPPSDFGGVALLDAATGQPVFVGETVWMGDEDGDTADSIAWPRQWTAANGLVFTAGKAEEPKALTVIDEWTGGHCCEFGDDDCDFVPCATGKEAFAEVQKSRLVRDMASCGSYSVLALMYPVSVGMTVLSNAEWVVVVTGKAPDEQTPLGQ